MALADQKCVPCSGETPPMAAEQAEKMLQNLSEGWTIKDDTRKLFKSYKFKNFKRAFAFVSQIADIAEEEGHHPNIHFTWGLVELEIWTHKIDGLAEADFVLAAKADRALAEMK